MPVTIRQTPAIEALAKRLEDVRYFTLRFGARSLRRGGGRHGAGRQLRQNEGCYARRQDSLFFQFAILGWPGACSKRNPECAADRRHDGSVMRSRRSHRSFYRAGTGGADVSLRSLDVRGNLTGQFNINKSSAEGLVSGIDNALTQVAADQADKVRDCLKPLRERILDVLFPSPTPSSRQSQPTRAPPSLRDLGGVAGPPKMAQPTPAKPCVTEDEIARARRRDRTLLSHCPSELIDLFIKYGEPGIHPYLGNWIKIDGQFKQLITIAQINNSYREIYEVRLLPGRSDNWDVVMDFVFWFLTFDKTTLLSG
jgi:hypothetical protein